MPDTSKNSWRCDWCDRLFEEKDFGYKARFQVDIKSMSNLVKSYDRHDEYVCKFCIDELADKIEV